MAQIDYKLHEIGDLKSPVFVLAFKGLFDIGGAATGAVDWLSMTHQGQPAASIDPELLFDFQETRPEIRIGNSGTREILWPSNNAVWAKTDDGVPDLVLLSGVEPNLRWRSFGAVIAELCERTETALVVTFGASLGVVPHSRRLPVKASTGSPELAKRLGVAKPSYEGPTGLIGSLHQFLDEAGIPAVSLTVSVPHYVPSAPSPKATAALLANFERFVKIPTGHAGMADDIRDWESRVHRAIEEDEEVRSYVADLEQQSDEEPEIVLDTSEVANEIEQFLRERRNE